MIQRGKSRLKTTYKTLSKESMAEPILLQKNIIRKGGKKMETAEWNGKPITNWKCTPKPGCLRDKPGCRKSN